MAVASCDIEYRNNPQDMNENVKTVLQGEEIPTIILQNIRSGRPEWIVSGTDFQKERKVVLEDSKPVIVELKKKKGKAK